MASDIELEKLRSLQQIIFEKISLEKEIKEIPKVLSDLEETLAKHKKNFMEYNLEFEKIKSEEIDIRNKLAEAEISREKAEKNMDAISTQREYEALHKEIQDATEKEQQYRKDLRQREIKLGELDGSIKVRTSLIDENEKELYERKMKIEAEITEKAKQIDSLRIQKDKLTENMDPEMVFKFERIIENKMGRGIVAIKGNVCMGCHMILPVQFANDVRELGEGDDYIFCPYCSRILYYEESLEGEEDFFNAEDMGALSDLDDTEEEPFEEEDDDTDDEEEGVINIDNEE